MDSHSRDNADSDKDEADSESPGDRSTTPDAAPPSNPNKHVSAEPPRWRFVTDAKKSSGYSSLAAGQYVQGKSGEELAGKYVAPDVSLYEPKGEKPQVGKLRHRPPAGDIFSKEDLEVGKLKLDAPKDETSSHQNVEVEELGRKAKEDDELLDPKTDVSTKPHVAEEGEDNENNVDGESPKLVESKNGEASPEIQLMSSGPHQKEAVQSDNQLDNEMVEEGTSLGGVVESRKGDAIDSAKEGNPTRRHRYLYLLIAFLLVLVIVLGILLGKKTNAEEASTISAEAAATPDSSDPSILMNNTSRPSSSPSMISTNKPPMRATKLPSKKPTTSPSKKPTSSPSKKPSTSPSEMPSAYPTKVPTDKPTYVPSVKPSARPTLPPTNIPTSKPACSADPTSFSLCVAVNMSGSLCNGPTGALCFWCPQLFQSSDPRESYCRDAGVAWGSCCANFAEVKELAAAIVTSLGNVPVETSFAVVQFASDARVVSGLSSASQTASTIGQLTYSGGLDDHAGAIQMCQQALSSSSNEKNIILLVTDGETGIPAWVSKGSTESAAAAAKSEGTYIFPVLVPLDPPDTNEGAISMFSGISSSGEVFDFTDAGTNPSVSKVREDLLHHISCPRG